MNIDCVTESTPTWVAGLLKRHFSFYVSQAKVVLPLANSRAFVSLYQFFNHNCKKHSVEKTDGKTLLRQTSKELLLLINPERITKDKTISLPCLVSTKHLWWQIAGLLCVNCKELKKKTPSDISIASSIFNLKSFFLADSSNRSLPSLKRIMLTN